jgi:Rrf2 family transcriptional regulator, iron-sulfur cluster assembly transcription factor
LAEKRLSFNPLQEPVMRLTTKGRFAVTAMIDLALRQDAGPVTLAAISQRQQISLSYLEQLFGKLRRHNLVESTRGPGGGYTLGRKSTDITVADIILSVDEPIDATHCAGKENCHGGDSRCMTHDLWASLNSKMVEFLDSVSLQKLVDDQLAKGLVVENKPNIKRAILPMPVSKPVRVTGPNSVFELGTVFAKS